MNSDRARRVSRALRAGFAVLALGSLSAACSQTFAQGGLEHYEKLLSAIGITVYVQQKIQLPPGVGCIVAPVHDLGAVADFARVLVRQISFYPASFGASLRIKKIGIYRDVVEHGHQVGAVQDWRRRAMIFDYTAEDGDENEEARDINSSLLPYLIGVATGSVRTYRGESGCGSGLVSTCLCSYSPWSSTCLCSALPFFRSSLASIVYAA